MKTLLMAIIFMGFNSYANEKGNGGSYDEAYIYGTQDNYNQIISKLSKFIKKHENEFAEFLPEKFVKVANELKLNVVDETLTDSNGVKGRTCLNFPNTLEIVCDIDKLSRIEYNPKAQFVLMTHEILGLLDIEKSSPYYPEQIDGYKISKKIAKYVTKIADYDLIFESREKLILELNELLRQPFDGHTPGFNCFYIGYQQVFLDEDGWLTVETYHKSNGGTGFGCGYENSFDLHFTRYLDLRKIRSLKYHPIPADRYFNIAASFSPECHGEECTVNENGTIEFNVSVIYFKYTHPSKTKRIKTILEKLIDTYR